nr:DUF3540 domain-containing protein [Burkholderia cepacia]
MRRTRCPGDYGAVLRTAHVIGHIDKWLLLDDSTGRARRASGCLLEPDIGDCVLIWAPVSSHAPPVDDGDSGAPCTYVLTVLARGDSSRATITLPGDAVLESSTDGLRIDAPRVAIAARDRIDADAPHIGLSAQEGRLRVAHLDACAQSIDGRASEVRLVAKHFTATIDRVLYRLGDCFRRVRGVDDTRAGRVRWQVNERAHLHARDVTLLADRQVGIDGERVELG